MAEKQIPLPAVPADVMSRLTPAQRLQVRESEQRASCLGQVTVEKGLGAGKGNPKEDRGL